MFHLKLRWTWPLSEDQCHSFSVVPQWLQMMVVCGGQRSYSVDRHKVNKLMTPLTTYTLQFALL